MVVSFVRSFVCLLVELVSIRHPHVCIQTLSTVVSSKRRRAKNNDRCTGYPITNDIAAKSRREQHIDGYQKETVASRYRRHVTAKTTTKNTKITTVTTKRPQPKTRTSTHKTTGSNETKTRVLFFRHFQFTHEVAAPQNNYRTPQGADEVGTLVA